MFIHILAIDLELQLLYVFNGNYALLLIEDACALNTYIYSLGMGDIEIFASEYC